MHYEVNGYNFKAELRTFPGGEEYIRLPQVQHPVGTDGTVLIYADLRSSQNIMQLLMVKDALQRARPDATFILDMGYLPYARQDRVCAKGESFSLVVFCNLINGMYFDEVRVTDCHSIVGLALLENVVEKTQLRALQETQTRTLRGTGFFNNIDVIVAPDAGASKKAQIIADYFVVPMVQCLKTRENGRITVELCGSVQYQNALVVDDIIDGGGTFLPLAEALHEAASIKLYATHGIFSKGKEALSKVYDDILAYSDWSK